MAHDFAVFDPCENAGALLGGEVGVRWESAPWAVRRFSV
jgi:hypothetical protein